MYSFTVAFFNLSVNSLVTRYPKMGMMNFFKCHWKIVLPIDFTWNWKTSSCKISNCVRISICHVRFSVLQIWPIGTLSTFSLSSLLFFFMSLAILPNKPLFLFFQLRLFGQFRSTILILCDSLSYCLTLKIYPCKSEQCVFLSESFWQVSHSSSKEL